MSFSMQQFVPDAKGRLGTARRWLGWQMIFPILLGVLFTLGERAIDGKGTIDWSNYKLYQCLVISIALFTLLYSALYQLLVIHPVLGVAGRTAAARATGSSEAIQTISEALQSRHTKLFQWRMSSVLLGALIILACWGVYIYCLYPGTMWYDTSWQVYEHLASTYDNGTLSDHHPFLLVYLYGFFIEFGRTVFNDGAAGMFVLVAIQIVAAVIAMSMICSYMHVKLGVRWGVSLATLLFFSLFPYLPMTYCSIVKDTLNTVLLMYFLMMFIEVIRTKGDFLKHAWVPIAFIILGLCICVSKKTGVYMIAPPLIACIFIKLKNGGRVFMPILGVFLFAFMLIILPRLVMPALNVEPGGKQEMLAVPIQQVAHEYVLYTEGEEGYEDAFSEEDEDLLNNFLTISTDEIPSEYDYSIVDPIKDGALGDESLIPEFLQLWWRLGTEHPLGHLEAWAGMEAGWISYSSDITVKVASGTIANNDFVSQYVTWPDSGEKNDFVTSLFNFVNTIPGIDILYAQSLWATVLPVFCMFVLFRAKGRDRWGRWNTLLAISPYLMTMVTLFVCPVSTGVEVARYILPMVCMAPLCLAYVISTSRTRLVDVLEPESAASDDAPVLPSSHAGASVAANAPVSASVAAASASTSAAPVAANAASSASAEATTPSVATVTTADGTSVRVQIAPKPVPVAASETQPKTGASAGASEAGTSAQTPAGGTTGSTTQSYPDPRPDAPVSQQ